MIGIVARCLGLGSGLLYVGMLSSGCGLTGHGAAHGHGARHYASGSALQGWPGGPGRHHKMGMKRGLNQPQGLWVTGVGRRTVEPDVAFVTVGIEGKAKKVARASERANKAMERVLSTLKGFVKEERHLRTTEYSITPSYRWVEKRTRQELDGYVVRHTVIVEMGDLKLVGRMLDAVTTAGGDLIRLGDIRFSSSALEQEAERLREAAVHDALAKAEQMAVLSGVSLGRLIYMKEVDAPRPISRGRSALKTMSTSVAISPGEMNLSSQVEAVFSVLPAP